MHNIILTAISKAIQLYLKQVRPTIRHIISLLAYTIRKAMPKQIQDRFPYKVQNSTTDLIQNHKTVSWSAVHHKKRLIRTPPIHILAQKLHWKFTNTHTQEPSTFVVKISNGRTVGNEGSIITEDNILLGDIARPIASTPAEHPLMRKLYIPKPEKLDEVIACLTAPAAHNYYHWLFDVLPKLALFEAEETKIDKYLTHTDTSFQKDSLYILGIHSNAIIPLHKKTHIQSKTIIAGSATGYAKEWTCTFLRNRFLSATTPMKKRRRLYISRGHHQRRHITNENEVLNILKPLGFETIRPEQLSFNQQIQLFSNAEVIISPHGAALANLVFCPPKTKVIELFSPTYVNICYWDISVYCQLEYGYLIGEGHAPPQNTDPHLLHTNIRVNCSSLKQMLNDMIR